MLKTLWLYTHTHTNTIINNRIELNRGFYACKKAICKLQGFLFIMSFNKNSKKGGKSYGKNNVSRL